MFEDRFGTGKLRHAAPQEPARLTNTLVITGRITTCNSITFLMIAMTLHASDGAEIQAMIFKQISRLLNPLAPEFSTHVSFDCTDSIEAVLRKRERSLHLIRGGCSERRYDTRYNFVRLVAPSAARSCNFDI